MLYVSTRNTTDTYTAYRALHEAKAPDGGIYVPFYLPPFSQEQLEILRGQTCAETVTEILNLFFGLRLNVLDVEFAMGKNPFRTEIMQHRIVMLEGWRNPQASFGYLLKSLYSLMTEHKSMGKLPVGWSCVAVEVALLFGMYTVLDPTMQSLDIAVTSCDYADLAAIAYAKKMGLPVNITVCSCCDGSALWDLLNRGELATGALKKTADRPDYLECYLFNMLGAEAANNYVAAVEHKSVFHISEEQNAYLGENLYVSVVSPDRSDTVAASVYRSNGYSLDTDAALAYGGLQDYRAATGVSMQTVILAKNRPIRMKE